MHGNCHAQGHQKLDMLLLIKNKFENRKVRGQKQNTNTISLTDNANNRSD